MATAVENTKVPAENNACVMLAIDKLGMEKRPMPGEPDEHE